VTDQPWHNYSGESAAALFALTGTHRADSLVVAFETALGQKAAKRGMAHLSQPELDVLAVEALEREVNNGGYGQFFSNSSNEYARLVVDALKRIGCFVTASITERAIAALPKGTPLSAEILEAVMKDADDERDDELQRCDEAYYASGEHIANNLLEYLLTNRDMILLLA
jgi:hypothetical protein